MADSIPICDVLTEAMDYLTKLGTNIRLRSEKLKDKRIRKDKLRNTHAIHKAVNKVLLICELSKKSIHNVENGVKYLLSEMEKAGATFGQGPKTRETSESGIKYEYFTYESHKLRIRDKISLGHYTSVKVVSTLMSLEMIEKYPIYHDCKLYRSRNKKGKELISTTPECSSSAIQDLDETVNICMDSETDTKDETSGDTDHRKIETIHELESICKEKNETEVKDNDCQLDDENSKCDVTQSNNLHEKNQPKNELEQPNLTVELSSPKVTKDESSCEPKSKKKKFDSKPKKYRHIRVMDSSSSSENEKDGEKTNPCDTNSKNSGDTDDTKEHNAQDKEEEATKQNDETNKPLIKCVSLTKLLKPDRIKDLGKENTGESKKRIGETALKLNQEQKKSELTETGKLKAKKPQKIHTYDEPDRIKDLGKENTGESKKRIGETALKVNQEQKNSELTETGKLKAKKPQKIHTYDVNEDEDEYLSRKRKEVKNFKSKEFHINLLRLPEITHTFLQKYSLNKVTHMGSVICEVLNDESKNSKVNNEKNDSDSKLKTQNVDINIVKSALLHDSDSDNIEMTNTDTRKEIEKITYGENESKNSDLEILKRNKKGQDITVSGDKSDENSCKLYCETNSNKTSELDESASNLDLKKKNVKSDTQESEKQNVEEERVNLQKVDSSLNTNLECGSNMGELKEDNEKFQNETVLNNDKNKNETNNETGMSVVGDKKEKNSSSHEDSHDEKNKSHVNETEKSSDSQNSHFENLKQRHTNKSHTRKKRRQVCASKKSLLDDSESGSQNDESPEKNFDKAKTSLHYESDSEPHKENEEEVSSTVKNALLADSDCESNIQIDKSSRSDEVIEPVLHQSNDNQEKIVGDSKDVEKVKSSLLEDSPDDNSRTPQKRKSSSDHSPPQSKRKHIMESMYAKKMLLTYSSSSDTEDEQLRNTLKEIKDYLLTGMSSDENSNKDKDSRDKEVSRSSSKSNSSESESEKELQPKLIKSGQSDNESQVTSSKDPTRSGSGTDNSSKCKVDRSITPDGTCSQNSDIEDTHDREIDGLTNLGSLKKTYRRRRPPRDRKTRRQRRMAKASGLISNEGFLEAESSSDAASLSGSEHADTNDLEDMPRVKLTDINGDGIGHLAKDDLLGESDTSISHDEKKPFKKEDDTDEDNVKSKRRKAIAISSDSEAGSSRRKDNNLRLSDFEDSEDENSEPVKNKRKKKVTDSDASGGSSDDGKKKRRRIKTLDESEGSGSDTENEGRNKHGRKNIRKVMSKNQLEEATKKAAREEKERIARITERQKLYNNLEFDESGKPDEVVLEKVVLDFDPETKEPLIQVDRGLVKKLKPHQANGIKFMWDACFESVKRIKKDKGSGCILAHCMGLGKTLQVVSLTHTLLTHGALTGVSRVLVVCPLSTVLNWVNEFRMWLKHAEADFEVDVYELSKFKQNSERAFQLSQWFEHGGVCVLGYEMFRNLSADKGKKFKKKILKNFQESLVDPGPDLVVCDEGHLLKNEKTSLSQSMNRVKTRRRIVLTGTPLQNNLKEYYCMVQFVKPNLLGKYNEYLNRFVNPITNGQYTDSTEHDIRVMKRRSHVLHKMLDGAVQRRDYGVLAPFLPPKHEYVLFITLTDVQIKLYHHYLDNYSRRPQPGKSSGFLFPDFQSLQRIWTHPLVLKYNSERYEIMQQKKREREEEDSEGSLVDFIDDDSTPDESSTEESSEDLSDLSDDSRKKSKKKKSAKKGKGKEGKASSRRGTRANPIELDDDEPIESLEVKSENPTEWWMKLVSEDELEDMRNSHKLILLFDILRQCEAIGDKLLVFSQSLYSLDLIEHFLGKVDEATQAGRVDEKLGGHVGSWSPGVDYFRLDGSTSCENRSIWCKNFNRIDNQRARLFLISTRAGGLGINLVAANRVVIFDVSWNPSHDVQSIFRVYRFGQKKPCYVYRFLAMGTMEEKIYERQVTKQAISKRVIDEQQIDRHYAENDLAELYKFEPQPPVPRPLPPLPKDRLFAEMLKEHEAQIYKYHEHDSLLENKEEETLSEEERRAAWEDFENEKTRPPPQPFLSPYAMHNGMVQGLLAQQQQMAMATISAMLRKDMPNMSEQQLRETVSLISASNPGMFGGYDYGLMQKMSEIYKYAQPGMMNPGMMNPMNAGSGMSGGSGMGASALHYEPPWQRQQQHQQQMRLQQLMQHQNSMGAKYYAGGLGSRDPMAMALQQQRARELMHRPRARGRPPLASAAPRPPPAHAPPSNPGDVVNLDSD